VAVLVTAGVIGVVTAACVPLDRPGIGWVGTGLAAAGGLAAVDRSWNIRRLAWTLGALALLAMGAIRAAGWLYALCVPTAGVAAALAITTGTSVRGMAAGVAAVPVAIVRAIPWAAPNVRPLASRLFASTNDAARQRPDTAPAGRTATPATPVAFRVLVVGVISIGLLWLFGALFASADAAFADLLDSLTPRADPDQVSQRLFLFTAGALGLLGAAYLLAAPPDLAGIEAPTPKRVHRWEWAVPVALLDLLFAAFVLVQVTVLFGGAQHVLDEHGPTYAEYARSGFWQLLTVTVLTLAVLGIAARRAPREEHADRTLIRVLLGALAGLTLVIVASALYRMNLYQQAYGFTRLRLLVSACELWLGAVFAMVLAAGVRLRARWLAQAVAGSATAALLGLALLNPDRFIADRNIDRYERTDRIDVFYLYQLSADAAPALDRLPYPLRDCALSQIASELTESDWRSANLGRERARDIIGDRPVRPDWALCKG
jgi:hypothetical protein